MTMNAPKFSRINSLWSVFYCFIVLGVEVYILHQAFTRYVEAKDKIWIKGKNDQDILPATFILQLFFSVLVILSLPFFIVSCILKVGNYANDGTKLGRDHALNANIDELCSCVRNETVKRIWRHFCPTAQVLHLFAAFLLLFPETLIQATEVTYGYLSSDVSWRSDIDFLFPNNRAMRSNIISTYNLTQSDNATFFIIPTARPGATSRTVSHSVSVAYVNFAGALVVFSVRYSAVFWYTSKQLCLLFVFLLISMSLDSLFSFCGFSVLFKVTDNALLHHNVSTSLGPGVIGFLYISGGVVLLLSSMTAFEYGANYFMINFKKSRHKNPNLKSFTKQTVVFQTSCVGYMSHSFAMGSLILLALFKGPLIYDMIHVYRVTKDHFILTCAVIDICYMLLWLSLWVFLTIKQEWTFVILEYVPLEKPIFTVQGEWDNKSTSSSCCKAKASGMNDKERPTTLGGTECTSSDSGMDMNGSIRSDDHSSVNFHPGDSSTSSSEENGKSDTSLVSSKNRKHRRVKMGSKVTFRDGSPIKQSAMATVPETSSSDSTNSLVNTSADVHKTLLRPDVAGATCRELQPESCFSKDRFPRSPSHLVHNVSISSDDVESNTSEPVAMYSSSIDRAPLALRSNSCLERRPRMGKRLQGLPPGQKSILKQPAMNKTISDDSGIHDTASIDRAKTKNYSLTNYNSKLSNFSNVYAHKHDSISSTETSGIDVDSLGMSSSHNKHGSVSSTDTTSVADSGLYNPYARHLNPVYEKSNEDSQCHKMPLDFPDESNLWSEV